MSGAIGSSFDNFWDFSVSPSSLTDNNREIGKRLKSVRAEQIQSIVDMIYDTLWDRLNFKGNPKVSHWLSPIGDVKSEAKSLLLKRGMFISDLQNHFAAGEASILLLGYPIEYSYEEILKYAVLFGELSLPFLIGLELAARDLYRISFSLDLKRTKECDELSFFIIEREGEEELSCGLYVLEEA